jgi:hypothetical protein
MRMRLHVLNFNIDCLEGSTLSLPIFQQCYNRTANDSNQTDTVSTREGPRRARFEVRAALGAVAPFIYQRTEAARRTSNQSRMAAS